MNEEKGIENDVEEKVSIERSISARDVSTGAVLNTGDTRIYNYGIQSTVLDRVVLGTLDKVSGKLSDKVAREVAEIGDRFRNGDMKKSFEELEVLRDSTVWDTYEPEVRASILRLKASMLLTLHGKERISDVKQLLDEAESTDSKHDTIAIRLRLEVYENGPGSVREPGSVNHPDILNVWLSCLLQTGRMPEIVAIRQNWNFDFKPDPETRRFFALALFAEGDVESAVSEVNKAMAEKPWLLVRYTWAMLTYFAALSRTVPFNVLIPYPRPVPTAWVMQDDASQQSLGKAADEFARLRDEFRQGSIEEAECELWAYACLHGSRLRNVDATNLGNELFEKNPANPRLLSWFITSGVEFDQKRSIDALETKLERGDHDIEDVLIAIRIYARHGQAEKGIGLLKAMKPLFVESGTIENWHFAKGQLHIDLRQADEARLEAEQISDLQLRRTIETNLLMQAAHDSKDWGAVGNFHRDIYEKDGDSESFQTAFEIYAKYNLEPEFVGANAEAYVQLMETAPALGFTVEALFKARMLENCVALLDKYKTLFPGDQPDDYLKTIEIECLRTLDIRRAVKKAEDLYRDRSTVQNLTLLIDLYLAKGDLLNVASQSKQLLDRKDATASTLLTAAHLLKVESPRLAEKLIRRAQAVGYYHDPNLVAFAHDIASKIGIKDVVSDAFGHLMKFTKRGEGPMTMMNIEEFLAIDRNSSDSNVKVEGAYLKGALPLHFYSHHRNISLVRIFRVAAPDNIEKPDLADRSRLYIRHGVRPPVPMDQFEEATQWNLHIDTSSLLIADELGILDKLEELFETIKIPTSTIKSLIDQRDKLRHHQREQVEASAIVTELLRRQKIQEVAASTANVAVRLSRGQKNATIPDQLDYELLARRLHYRAEELADAVETDGMAVGFRPMNAISEGKWISIELPDHLATRFTTTREILEVLLEASLISDEKLKSVLAKLGLKGEGPRSVRPKIGSKLFLMSGLAEFLAGGGILEDICEHFDLYMSPASILEARHPAENEQLLVEVGNTVDELIQRLSLGIDESKYDFIRPAVQQPDSEIAAGKYGLDAASVTELLTFELRERDVIAIDDRFVTRHMVREGEKFVAPIIGIMELLSALLTNAKIDEQTYYNHLLNLRRANYRYLPITGAEIQYHLNRAQMANDGSLIETNALCVLRQYYSSCLLDEAGLQISEDSFSEAPFVARGMKAVTAAIAEVFFDDQDENLIYARADWLLENMYTGLSGTAHLGILESAVPLEPLAATDIIALVTQSILIPESGLPFEDPKRRMLYFNWLKSRILRSKFATDPDVRAKVGEIIKTNLVEIAKREFEDDKDRLISGIILGRFYLTLPEEIRDLIELEPELAEHMGVDQQKVVSIGDLEFRADEYWFALNTTVTGTPSTIASLSGDATFTLSLIEDRECQQLSPKIKMTDDKGEEQILTDQAFRMFLPDEMGRAQAIREIRYIFDCDDTEFENVASEILSIEDPIRRIERFLKIQHSSLRLYYQDLENRMRKQIPVFWTELMPPAIGNVLGHYRVPLERNARPFAEVWDQSVAKLTAEEGLETSISRCINLPLELPAEIMKNFSKLPVRKRAEMLERFAPQWASPLRLLHCTNLALVGATAEDSELIELAKSFVKRVYSEGTDDSANPHPFFRVLQFAFEKVDLRWNKDIPEELSMFIAWAHGTMIYHIHRSSGFTDKDIFENFSDQPLDRDLSLFELAVLNPRDVLRFPRATHKKLVTHAAAKLFAGIDPSFLEEVGLTEALRAIVFDNKDTEGSPNMHLFHDPLLATDKLGSLFGGDRFAALSELIGCENIDMLKSESLETSVKQCLEEFINDPTHVSMIFGVYLVVADLPIYENLRDLTREALMKIEAAALFSDEKFDGNILMLAAATQVQYLDDEDLRERFKQLYKEVVAINGRGASSDAPSDGFVTLLGVARVIVGALDSTEKYLEFIGMVRELKNAWPEESDKLGFLLARAPLSVDLEVSRELWKEALVARTHAGSFASHRDSKII
jgi:tetratricopeptide (TPR) repeat protein